MKLALILSFTAITVAAVSTGPERAAAFDTGRVYAVYIFNGLQKIDTGELRSTLFEYVDDDGHEACSYFATWDGNPLFFDERVTPGYLDCETNRTIGFSTLIVNSPEYENSGADKFLEGQSIQNMILSEDANGSAFGVITFDTNLPYPMLIEPL